MTQAKPRFRSINEYLEYDDGTDSRAELVDGLLVEMAPENPINSTIASFLFAIFLEIRIPYYRLAIGHQIATSSSKVTARQPDLVVHTEESAAAILAGGSLLLPEMPPPLLVIEIVSSSTNQQSSHRDYVDKRLEYQERGIPEYWIVDPDQNIVVVLSLEGTQYIEIGKFTDSDRIVSPAFPELQLTAEQILKAGR